MIMANEFVGVAAAQWSEYGNFSTNIRVHVNKLQMHLGTFIRILSVECGFQKQKKSNFNDEIFQLSCNIW